MKLVKILCIVSALVMFSCNKENDVVSPVCEEESAIVKSRPDVTVAIHFTWDEWGRKKLNCNGAGLCNFRVVKVEAEGSFYLKSSTVKSSEIRNDTRDGRLYTNVLADDDLKFESPSKDLYIDEDLFAEGPDGKTYVLPKGIYPIDLSMGTKGGYKLPIEVAYSSFSRL